MNFKKVAVAGMLLVSAMGAQAADYNLGNLSAGYTNFTYNVASGSFMDKIAFNLTSQSNGSFGAGALNFTVGGVPLLNISGLSLSLFDGSDNQLGNGLDFSINALNGGNYYLKVSGVANGLAGGMYGGGINVSAVPEPGTWTTLLAGLAMFGFMAYRRRQQ